MEKDDYLVYPILQTSKEKKFIPTKIVTIPFGIGRHKSEKVLHLSLDPDFYRLLGYFFAEGHIDNEHYLTFTFHIKEKEYLEDVKTLLHKYFKKDSIEGKVRNHGKTITLCSTIAARYFAMEFGSTNKTKHMPLWVLESPQEHLRELMKAMWRGDGSFDKKIICFDILLLQNLSLMGFET